MFNSAQLHQGVRGFANFCKAAAEARQEEERAAKAKQLNKEIKTIEKSMTKLLKKAETKANPTKIRRQLEDLQCDLVKVQKKQAKLTKEQSEVNVPVTGSVDPFADLTALAARLDGKTVEEDSAELERLAREASAHRDYLDTTIGVDESLVYWRDALEKLNRLTEVYVDDRLSQVNSSEDSQAVGSQPAVIGASEVPLETVSIADLNPKVIMYNADTGQALGAMAEAMIRSGAVKAP